MLGLRLLVSSLGGFTRTAVSGRGNMSAYTVVKNDGCTLVTTVINANDAAKVGCNPVTLSMPEGCFTVGEARHVFAASNDVRSATQLLLANPLPENVPSSGEERTASSSSANASAGSSTSPAQSGAEGMGRCRLT